MLRKGAFSRRRIGWYFEAPGGKTFEDEDDDEDEYDLMTPHESSHH
jgi:hypothetical protein